MGCDIHMWAERTTATGYEAVTDVQFADPKVGFFWLLFLMGLGCGIPLMIIFLSGFKTAELGDSPDKKNQRETNPDD